MLNKRIKVILSSFIVGNFLACGTSIKEVFANSNLNLIAENKTNTREECLAAYKKKILEITGVSYVRFWIGDINKDGTDDLLVTETNDGQNHFQNLHGYTYRNNVLKPIYKTSSPLKLATTDFVKDKSGQLLYAVPGMNTGKMSIMEFNIEGDGPGIMVESYPINENPERIKKYERVGGKYYYDNSKPNEWGPLEGVDENSINATFNKPSGEERIVPKNENGKTNSNSQSSNTTNNGNSSQANISTSNETNNKSTANVVANENKSTITEDQVKSVIIKNDKAYAIFTQNGDYDASMVSIEPGSQMESKWIGEIDKHISKGSTFQYIDDKDIIVNFDSNTSGTAQYVSVLKGLTTGNTYENLCIAKFKVINGNVVFYEEIENDGTPQLKKQENPSNNSSSNEQEVINTIVANDSAYATFTQNGAYDASSVSIQPGSQMETKWINEIAKHKSKGSTFEFIDDKNIIVNFTSPTSGTAQYTTVLRGLTTGRTYGNVCVGKFNIENGRVVFYEETETSDYEDALINTIIANDKAYALFTQNGAYNAASVSIKPGSQMETKWINEIEKHRSKGSTFQYIDDKDISYSFVTPTSGYATYTTVLKGLTTGNVYNNVCYAKFIVDNGRIVFTEEYEDETQYNGQIESSYSQGVSGANNVSVGGAPESNAPSFRTDSLPDGTYFTSAVSENHISNKKPYPWVYQMHFINGNLSMGGSFKDQNGKIYEKNDWNFKVAPNADLIGGSKQKFHDYVDGDLNYEGFAFTIQNNQIIKVTIAGGVWER